MRSKYVSKNRTAQKTIHEAPSQVADEKILLEFKTCVKHILYSCHTKYYLFSS